MIVVSFDALIVIIIYFITPAFSITPAVIAAAIPFCLLPPAFHFHVRHAAAYYFRCCSFAYAHIDMLIAHSDAATMPITL